MCSTASCSALYLPTDNTIHRSLYMDDSLYPTIDRAKPNLPSSVYVWDNTCSALDAEWQCMPYALDKCESLRGGKGWSEDYMQCLDDRFTACRKGAGCDYRYELAPENCSSSYTPPPLDDVIRDICNAPEKEYASWQSYQACVDKVTQWAQDGCRNIRPQQMAGPITNQWLSSFSQ